MASLSFVNLQPKVRQLSYRPTTLQSVKMRKFHVKSVMEDFVSKHSLKTKVRLLLVIQYIIQKNTNLLLLESSSM